jgi:hypothetical protein
MNSLEFLYELSWAKSNPLKLDSFAALAGMDYGVQGKWSNLPSNDTAWDEAWE